METWAVLLLAVGLALCAIAIALWWRGSRAGRAVPAPSAAAPPGERIRRGLLATSRRLSERMEAVFGAGPRPLDTVLAELEEALVGADVGTRTAAMLIERVRAQLGRTADPTDIRRVLRAEIETVLTTEPLPEAVPRPWVVLVVGVNGVGKTTTIGKLAARYAAAGRRVLMVAADTFRAAAIDQLAIWAGRTGAAIVRHASGADPAAVVFDGMKAALARQVDVVLIDTAGRLHTRVPLMEELRKLRRVIGREVPGAPHATWLVVDATTGQNALSQARVFTEAVEVTGVILVKLDGTARGGVAIAVGHDLGLPIRYVGVGEGADDLHPFDPSQFVEALFDTTGTHAADPVERAAGVPGSQPTDS